jgi:chromosome segregation ATPase
MSIEHGPSTDIDLEKTDRLPILEGVQFDPDVEDDAVRMEQSDIARLRASPPAPSVASAGVPPDFMRPPAVDLPSLATSLRSVEERIARQTAEYEALNRRFERARDAESAAKLRADALEKDLASARAALATRDATIVQVLHSLGERDAQLAAVQADHARTLQLLESGSKSAQALQAELTAAHGQVNQLGMELASRQNAFTTLQADIKARELEVNTLRAEFAAQKTQASTYLEVLRTREWRQGFDQNLFRELDAKVGAADAGRDSFESERNRLLAQVEDLESRLAAQTIVVQRLESANATHLESLTQRADAAARDAATRLDLEARLTAADTERARLQRDIGDRDRLLAEASSAAGADVQRVKLLLEAAELGRAELDRQIAQLQSEAEEREQQMAVLMAHLHEARRPIETIEAETRGLRQELVAKTAAFERLEAETIALRANLERTRGALEEREFLIRRLERSESNNANVLGRIQTSMERLGSAATPGGSSVSNVTALPEWSAELIRIHGDRQTTHTLARRTRIGRAAGCELQVDSSSVSRHHALIVAGPRETIIEDLNSTNGVILNGRKISRAFLNDGDLIVVGEIQFRYATKGTRPAGEPPPAELPGSA